MHRYLTRALSIGTAFLLALAITPASPAAAEPVVYYVNSSSATCDDAGDGVSADSPWCSLDAASRTYSPGDQLLIARGSTYAGEFLTVSGQGTANARILIGAYGEGAAPHLDGEQEEGRALVLLQNPSYVTVRDLELSHAGAGALAQYRGDFPGPVTGNSSIVFEDLYVHHIAGLFVSTIPGGPADFFCKSNDLDLWQSAGAGVTGDYYEDVPSDSYFVSGVTFERIVGHDNLNVINVDMCDGRVGEPNSPGPAAPHLVRDVTVNNVHAYDGNGAGYAQQCNEGMRFDAVTGLTVMNSRFESLGACYVPTGTAGFILVSVDDVTFKNNVLSDTPNTGSNDQTAIDNELYVNDVTLRNNLIARNAGPGVEFLSLRPQIADYNTNHRIEGNSFYGNGGGSLYRLGNAPFTGTIANNLSADSRFVYPEADFAPLIGNNTKNTTAATGTVPFYAADHFGDGIAGDPWSYRVGIDAQDVLTWDAAGYTANAHIEGVWGDGAQRQISAFEQTPGTARVWTAPASGDISLRSLAFKTEAGGGSATATVLLNGTPIRSESISGNNTEGLSVDADISVNEGDTLAFAITGASDGTEWTSWVPSIMYVATPTDSPDGVVRAGSFEAPVTGGFEYSPRNDAWSFISDFDNGAGAGIVRNNGPFGNLSSPEGSQAGFIQGQGSMAQSIADLRPGVDYSVELDVASRGAEAGQSVEVLWDEEVIATIPASDPQFVAHSVALPAITSGSHLLTLRGTVAADRTAFVDDVRITYQAETATAQFADSSFETPAASGINYAVTGSPWSYSPVENGNGSGTASNGSGFGQPNAPDGAQVAFVQRGGSFQQTTSGFEVGASYAIEVQAAQRGSESQQIEVLIDGVPIGVIVPQSSAWASYRTPIFTATATEHVITFRGLASADYTALLDTPTLLEVSTAGVGDAASTANTGRLPDLKQGETHG
ncbi:right-handed parallel beta-helix repeat-containing protein [Plantibacter sp. MMLR14_011]|uniref:right-handed parallel beta-helix repeat-containing protein n=1 Tax=Plantibacter sp. MMLR14_011 TaxID=1898746 RepID=UPI0009F334AF|nr:right-handed parallel beta-helix repeat-containing protein [Plantibacter sp. MMLR14_011]